MLVAGLATALICFWLDGSVQAGSGVNVVLTTTAPSKPSTKTQAAPDCRCSTQAAAPANVRQKPIAAPGRRAWLGSFFLLDLLRRSPMVWLSIEQTSLRSSSDPARHDNR